MGIFFRPKMGTWTIHSDSDPRWRATGRAAGLVCGGGPQELHDKIAEFKKLYGDPPADCIHSFIKD